MIARELQTIGIGAGQMSRVDAVRIAIDKATQLGHDLAGSVLASDAFFPFADGPQLALDAGVAAIVQPGGSRRDDEVVEASETAGAAMIFTGRGTSATEPDRIASSATGSVGRMPDPNRWKVLAIVCAAFFMTILDVSIVNVALPSIGRSLHFSQDGLQWVITAYAITFGGFLLLGGRAADFLGRRRIFLIGVVVFTLASFFCGLAWSAGVLIAVAGRAGVRCRAHHAGCALDHHDGVRRGRRAQQGPRHLGRDRRLRRSGRRARRRPAHEVRRLGVDLLRQRPGGVLAFVLAPARPREQVEREPRRTSRVRSR